jgi:integrase
MCRKRRYIEFFRFQSKTEDIALFDLRFVERAVTKGWLTASVYRLYRCEYKEPEPDWLTMEEMVTLKDWVFKDDRLGEVRDIFIFGSFTGLSYHEIRTLRPADIRTIDGTRCISKTRRKTHNEEALPLLPLAAQLLEKYANHPDCVRTGRLLPLPTNQEYNRRLKVLMKETGITNINLRSHKLRYFFANEIAFNNRSQNRPPTVMTRPQHHGILHDLLNALVHTPPFGQMFMHMEYPGILLIRKVTAFEVHRDLNDFTVKQTEFSPFIHLLST